MEPADFTIGQHFFFKGQKYRCTDIGTRTVVATCVDMKNPEDSLYQMKAGEEILLDESKLAMCDKSQEGSMALCRELDLYYSFSNLAKMVITKEKAHYHHAEYPNHGQFGRARVNPEGELIYPYSARLTNNEWSILCYMPGKKVFIEIDEKNLLHLAIKK